MDHFFFPPPFFPLSKSMDELPQCELDDKSLGAYVHLPHKSLRDVFLAFGVGKTKGGTGGSVLWDIGCGDGRSCIIAVEQCGASAAMGVDIDEPLVEQFAQKVMCRRLEAKISCVCGDALAMVPDEAENDAASQLHLTYDATPPAASSSVARSTSGVLSGLSCGDYYSEAFFPRPSHVYIAILQHLLHRVVPIVEHLLHISGKDDVVIISAFKFPVDDEEVKKEQKAELSPPDTRQPEELEQQHEHLKMREAPLIRKRFNTSLCTTWSDSKGLNTFYIY